MTIKRWFPAARFSEVVGGEKIELFVLCSGCNVRLMGFGTNKEKFCPLCGSPVPYEISNPTAADLDAIANEQRIRRATR